MISLQIVVAGHCWNCKHSLELASKAAEAFPDVQVDVVDVGRPGATLPEGVFATPTYLLNGDIVWLGNPSDSELFARLHDALAHENLAQDSH